MLLSTPGHLRFIGNQVPLPVIAHGTYWDSPVPDSVDRLVEAPRVVPGKAILRLREDAIVVLTFFSSFTLPK